MLKATEPVAMGWFERQLDATYFALEKIETLAHCGDLSEAVEIQREWFEAAGKRLSIELEKLTEQATSLSREAVSATRDAMQPVSETHQCSGVRPRRRNTRRLRFGAVTRTDI
jgi:hypothetical protein